MANRNKSSGKHLTKAYRQIGIRAVSAAMETNKQAKTSHTAQTDVGQSRQGDTSMNAFAEKTTRTARENFERDAEATEHATRNAQQSYSGALAGIRELNVKLIEMAHDNTEAVFDLAHEIASAESPSDLAEIWAEHARRQFELMTKQSKEFTELGQKLGGRATFGRTISEVFARGT
jgi:phasin